MPEPNRAEDLHRCNSTAPLARPYREVAIREFALRKTGSDASRRNPQGGSVGLTVVKSFWESVLCTPK